MNKPFKFKRPPPPLLPCGLEAGDQLAELGLAELGEPRVLQDLVGADPLLGVGVAHAGDQVAELGVDAGWQQIGDLHRGDVRHQYYACEKFWGERG